MIIKKVVFSKMPKTEAKARADAKYDKKTYDRLVLKVRKDSDLTRDQLRAHAVSCGESLNAFVKRAILEAIEHDEMR